MATMLRSGLCVLLAVLATAASAAGGPERPRLPPGMAKYIMVLWEPGTRKPNGETAKRGEEPDLGQHGGRVEASWSSHRVIVVPLAAVRQLREHRGVAYLQRVWTGESREEWLEPEPGPGPSAGARVASESDTDLTWGPLQYAYDSSGNIKQMGTAAELQAQAEDHYTYDSAGRLIGSRVNGKTERYQYDAFGNLTSKSVDGEVAVTNTVDGASNRLAGEIYDAAGNVTTSRSGHALRYDSLNMVSSIRRFDTRRWMVYDASDERIGVVNGPDLSRWTIRGLNGQVLREFTGFETSIGNPYWEWKQDSIYADGRLVAGDRQIWPQYEEATTRYGGRRHYHLDHLGSVRVVTDREGRSISEHEYFPFGATQTRTHQEQIDPGDPHLDTHRFAGHTRDFLGSLDEEAADYLDYMHARYYDPNRGRFLSPDPVNDVRAITRPQGWNRYAYVMNNPLRYTDPTGLLWFKLDGEWRFVKDANVMQVDTFDKNGKLVSSQMLKGVKFGLVFNGTGLTQLREDGTTRTIPAVSGSVSGWGEVHPEQQGDRNRGPIPEGQYSFNRSDIQTMGTGDQALGLFKRGAWPGSAFAWGKQRAFLTPSPGTNTRGRSGFSIHGGVQPGSAGCIDLCDMVSVFFSEIPADAGTIPVDVDYSNPFPKP